MAKWIGNIGKKREELEAEYAALSFTSLSFEEWLIAKLIELEAPVKMEAILCQFCGKGNRWHEGTGKLATVFTSSDDFVCETCRDEFEDALEQGEE